MTRIALLVLFVCGCSIKPPEPPPGSPTCATACQRLVQLNCDGSKPTPEGATCEDVCKNIQESGLISWDLRCRTNAPSCAAVDNCER
jgi:hypothetical protein